MAAFEPAMQEALRDSRYSYLTGRFDGIIERIEDIIIRILEFIVRQFDAEFTGFGEGVNTNVISGTFTVLAIVFIVALVAFFAHMVFKHSRAKNRYSEEIFEDYRANRLSYDEVMALVAKHDAEENFKEAVRYRYIGLIMLFNAKEIVKVTDSMTGGQFEREAARNISSAQNGVRETVNMYYYLFFGHKAVSPTDYAKYLQAYNAVIKEAHLYEKN